MPTRDTPPRGVARCVALLLVPTVLLLAGCAMGAPAVGAVPAATRPAGERPAASADAPQAVPDLPVAATATPGRRASAVVLAYLAAAVRMARTGDDTAFLALTSPRCGCRRIRDEAVARGRAGGADGFDVRVERAVAGAPSSLGTVDVEVRIVIAAHVDPAAPGYPREVVPQRRQELTVVVDLLAAPPTVVAVLHRVDPPLPREAS